MAKKITAGDRSEALHCWLGLMDAARYLEKEADKTEDAGRAAKTAGMRRAVRLIRQERDKAELAYEKTEREYAAQEAERRKAFWDAMEHGDPEAAREFI